MGSIYNDPDYISLIGIWDSTLACRNRMGRGKSFNPAITVHFPLVRRISDRQFSQWRWLFALEGGLTTIIGVFAGFYLPPSPTQTKGWFRGRDGWFNEREEKIMVNRVLRDDPAKGGMHNRQGLTLTLLWEALCDYDLWPIYLLGITWTIPATPITAYLTLNLKSLGFDTFRTNLLTIPAYFLFLLQLLWWTWVSERWNNRFGIVLVSMIWCFPLILALELLPSGASPWAWYACSALLVGYPYVHAIIGEHRSTQTGPVRNDANGLFSSGNHLAQRRVRPDPHSWLRNLQHDGPGREHYRIQRKCLPRAPFLLANWR